MNYLKNTAVSLFFVALTGLANHVSAWSEQGHRWLSDHVFQQLSMAEKSYYQGLAHELNLKNKNDQAAFVFMADFPDAVRKETLGRLFARFNAPLPKSLHAWINRDSRPWHYHNNVTEKRCRFINKGELLSIMDLIDAALKAPANLAQEALLMSFQIHFIQDIHQPLHTFTKLNKRCDSDLGGNLTCVEQGPKKGKCELNLHRWWDRGFGVFNEASVNLASDVDTGFQPIIWSQENLQVFDELYDFSRENYRPWAKSLVQQRTHQAMARQLSYLQAHVKRQVAQSE